MVGLDLFQFPYFRENVLWKLASEGKQNKPNYFWLHMMDEWLYLEFNVIINSKNNILAQRA